MKRKIFNLILGQAFLCSMIACQSQKSNLTFENQGDSLTIVRITHPTKYLLLPIQEAASEGKVKLDTGSPADMAMDVRLAVDSIEYYVPFELPQGVEEATVTIGMLGKYSVVGYIQYCKYRLLPSYLSSHSFIWMDE